MTTPPEDPKNPLQTTDPNSSPEAEEGGFHLTWITRFQVALLALGTALWALRSLKASLAFLLAGGISLAFWFLHRWVVGGMLTPNLRRRWVFALLALAKLALIAFGLRAMMTCFPGEAHSLATGILVFAGGILLEAIRLVVRPGTSSGA